MRRRAVLAVFPFLFVVACGRTPVPPSKPSLELSAAEHRKEFDAWVAAREERLKQPEGWLSLVALGWLEEGENTAGSAAGSTVALPADHAPAKLGTFLRKGREIRFRPEPGQVVTLDETTITSEVPLVADSGEKPSVLAAGSLRLFLIERGDLLGIRVKDRESPLIQAFQGMKRFPFDPSWRVIARWEPYDPPKRIGVPTILGTIEESPCPGAAVFERDGVTYRLEPILERGSDEWFFIVGDKTNGQETYGGGRFLYAAPATEGRIALDFNKAYDPPCVFTPFATCPVPPPQNRLALRITAGELAFEGGAAHP